MAYKRFIISLSILCIGTFIISLTINILDIDVLPNSTTAIRKYQLNKIKAMNKKNIQTVIVGDSSARHAIDPKYFALLSNQNTLNLSLQGSFGIESTLNIIKRCENAFPNLKNIIIIHTLEIWHRPFSYQGYYTTMPSIININNVNNIAPDIIKQYLIYLFNPKQIFWLFKDIYNLYIKKKEPYIIKNDTDLYKQSKKRYSNKKKKVDNKMSIPEPFSLAYKQKTYKLLDKYCSKQKFNCTFANGPILNIVSSNSQKEIKKIQTFLYNNSKHIFPITNIFEYPLHKMGNALDHVDPNFKKEVTLEYFNLINKNFKIK